MQERLARGLLVLLEAAAVVGAVWLSLRFLLPWTAPFLAAWALAALLEPAVRFLVRHRWRRRFGDTCLFCCRTQQGRCYACNGYTDGWKRPLRNQIVFYGKRIRHKMAGNSRVVQFLMQQQIGSKRFVSKRSIRRDKHLQDVDCLQERPDTWRNILVCGA